MNKQSGFALVEGVLVLVIVVVIGGAGYVVWHRQHTTAASASTASTTTPVAKLTYTSPPVTTATAPAVTSGSDLNGALNTLNQTDVNAGSTDSAQLGSQAAGL